MVFLEVTQFHNFRDSFAYIKGPIRGVRRHPDIGFSYFSSQAFIIGWADAPYSVLDVSLHPPPGKPDEGGVGRILAADAWGGGPCGVPQEGPLACSGRPVCGEGGGWGGGYKRGGYVCVCVV